MARLEPLLATLCATMANAFRGKGQRRAKAEDFIPDYERPYRREDGAAMIARFSAFARAHNARLPK